MTARETLTGAPSGFYRDVDGDLWVVSERAGAQLLAHDVADIDETTRADGDQYDYMGTADSPVGAGPFMPMELVEKLAPPLPETPGSLVKHDGTRYVRIVPDAADGAPDHAWRLLTSGFIDTRRTTPQLAGAEILFDASTLTSTTQKGTHA